MNVHLYNTCHKKVFSNFDLVIYHVQVKHNQTFTEMQPVRAVADLHRRVGSCPRPGMVRRPVISEKNVLLKRFLHSFINSKHSMFRFYARCSCLCKTAWFNIIVWTESVFFLHIV